MNMLRPPVTRARSMGRLTPRPRLRRSYTIPRSSPMAHSRPLRVPVSGAFAATRLAGLPLTPSELSSSRPPGRRPSETRSRLRPVPERPESDSSARSDMPVIILSPAIPDLKVFRAYPCSAIVAPDTGCGATPANLYRIGCGVLSHTREVWLCPTHATMAAVGGAICKACAARGGIAQVSIQLIGEPLRF